MRKGAIRAHSAPVVTAVLSSAWFLSFFFGVVGGQVIGFALQIALFIFATIFVVRDFNSKRFVISRLGYLLVGLNIFWILNIVKDAFSAAAILLAVKNVIYVNASIVIGTFIAAQALQTRQSFVLWGRCVAYSHLLAGVILVWMFFGSGYSLGASLLGTDLAENYQGLSRTFGQIAVFSAIFLGIPLAISSLFVAIFVSISFSSFGAFVAIGVAIVCLLKRFHGAGKFLTVKALVLLCLCIVGVATLGFIDADVYLQFASRLQDKVDAGGESDGRLWIYARALEHVFGSVWTFLFGPNIFDFSCAVNFCEYRHAHNIFLNLWFFFGLFSLPIYLFLMHLVGLSAAFLFRDGVPSAFSAMLLFYFGLSLFGGDLEQNRNLFMFMASVAYIRYYEKRKDHALTQSSTSNQCSLSARHQNFS